MPFMQSERSRDLCLMGKGNPGWWLEWQACSIEGITQILGIWDERREKVHTHRFSVLSSYHGNKTQNPKKYDVGVIFSFVWEIHRSLIIIIFQNLLKQTL